VISKPHQQVVIQIPGMFYCSGLRLIIRFILYSITDRLS
jgi:hypothetical protein